MSKKTIKIGEIQRRALIDPGTVNADQRTVEVTFSTDNKVRMSGWDGPYLEILSHDPTHVRMDRINSGAPLLDNHDRWGSVKKSVIGVVDRAWIDGNKGRAVVRFSKKADADEIFKDVQDGIIRNLSVGYRVYKYQKIESEGGIPEYRAIDWEPNEISFVSVPADFEATVRSEGENNTVEILQSNKQSVMNRAQIEALLNKRGIEFDAKASDEELVALLERALETPAPAPAAPTPPAQAPSETESAEEVRAAERKRASDINEAVRKAGLDLSFAERLITKGDSIDAARQAIIEEFSKQDPNKGRRAGSSATVQADEADKRRQVIAEAIVLRSGKPGATTDKDLVAAANEYRHMTLLDLAKDSLDRIGERHRGLSPNEIAERAITSSGSDFAIALDGTARRVLLGAFNTIPDTWRQFCKVGSVGDFREWSRLRSGTLSRLTKMDEHDEYKTKKINDAEREKIKAETFGDIINLSRKMIINDDLGYFTDLAANLGRAAARSIEIDVYTLLQSNPVMGDGKTLFHADHDNIGTPAALSVSSLDADRVLMAKQMDKDKNDFLDLRPQILLLPIGLGGEARVINDAQFDVDSVAANSGNKFQKPNKVRGLFQTIIDTPRLDGTTRYLFADPSIEPVLETVFLNGVQTPYTEQKMGWSVDGMEWKIRYDYGVGAIGWRGIVRNAGA